MEKTLPEINPRDMVTDWAISLDPGNATVVRLFRKDTADKTAASYGDWYEITESIAFCRMGATVNDLRHWIAKNWTSTATIVTAAKLRANGQVMFMARENNGYRSKFRAIIQ